MVDRILFIKKGALLPIVTLACTVALCIVPNKVHATDTAVTSQVMPPQTNSKKTKDELLSPENVIRISQTYGHFIAKNLNNPVLVLNFDAVIDGMKAEKEGNPSPMSEQEYEEAVTQLQEITFQETAAKNLQEAEKFLELNAKNPGVQVLESGKLQILVEKAGTSDETVTETVVPVIHYTGSYANGAVFGSSKDSKEPLSIPLNQTIPGFKKGILGMKVGEVRRIYIHPDLGYGTSGQLMPNALLIFDIELVKTEPLTQEDDSADDDFDSAIADSEDDDLNSDDDTDDSDANDDDLSADQDIDFDTADDGASDYGT